MKRILFLLFALGLALPGYTTVPNYMSYSGKLVNKSGQVLPDGDYAMSFELYNASSGGTKIWDELHGGTNPKVHVAAGSFHVILGKIGPSPLPDFSENLWLQVSVEIDSTYEVFGRQEMISVPYALRAQIANSVADNAVDTQNKAPWAPLMKLYEGASPTETVTVLDKPIIAYGSATTNDAGSVDVVITQCGFSEPPQLYATAILWDFNYPAFIVFHTTTTKDIFHANSVVKIGSQFIIDGPILFNWIAIGK